MFVETKKVLDLVGRKVINSYTDDYTCYNLYGFLVLDEFQTVANLYEWVANNHIEALKEPVTERGVVHSSDGNYYKVNNLQIRLHTYADNQLVFIPYSHDSVARAEIF